MAVRSSATSEDSSNASFAGQFSTYLNVSKGNLIQSIKNCFASLFNPRVLNYLVSKNISSEEVSMAVLVQKMVKSDVSGVTFTINPVTGDSDQLLIESVEGLGDKLVSGAITPDQCTVQKSDLRTVNKKVGGILSYRQIREVATNCIEIENHFGLPQDIEWAWSNDKLFILQSRPISTLHQKC